MRDKFNWLFVIVIIKKSQWILLRYTCEDIGNLRRVLRCINKLLTHLTFSSDCGRNNMT